MKNQIRVRFAPSPTGLMHLGSIRTALFNYIFARQKKGTFIVRVEDTDPERNFDSGATKILSDMAWLGLAYDEGPQRGGPYHPYFQSKRSSIYQEHLEKLKQKNAVYRCFCSEEMLEKKRERQKALKQPPRYDKTCLRLSPEEVEDHLTANNTFIWRFNVDRQGSIIINDLARGSIKFDLKNFSDFPLTRANDSFTFLFANAVDDMVMRISHVFRGEDHISNTPCQALLYRVLEAELPVFWHMPIICTVHGKKLSKRDFGFSLQDLQMAGFLPEAINNYLAIIGGSFENEIMPLDKLVKAINFEHLHTSNAIKYDLEKLTWVNHQWIMRYSQEQLLQATVPRLRQRYPQINKLDKSTLAKLITMIQPELKKLEQASDLVQFYFERPAVTANMLYAYVSPEHAKELEALFTQSLSTDISPDQFFENIKAECRQRNIPPKLAWKLLRVILTGTPSGPGIRELIDILGNQETLGRIRSLS